MKKAALVLFSAGILFNPNIWVPLLKLFTGAGIPPISWQSATVISVAICLLGVLAFVASSKPKWKSALFLYVIVLLVLIASEAGLRLLRPPAALIQDIGYPEGLLIADPIVGRGYQPNFQGHFTYQMYDGIPIRTNSMGYRDSEPDPNVKNRILVLGDSITFGSGVREEERYTDVLETELRKAEKVEVQSLGINGTETAHQLRLYEKEGGKISHNRVVIGFCLNDVAPISANDLYQKTLRKTSGGATLSDKLGERGLSLHYSFLVRLSSQGMGAVISSLGMKEESAVEKHRRKYQEYLNKHWNDPADLEIFAANLNRIKTLAEANGASLTLLVFPYRFQFESGDFTQQEKLQQICETLGIEMIDLQKPFEEAMKNEKIYLPGDDCHPNTRGHRIAGEVLAQELANSW